MINNFKKNCMGTVCFDGKFMGMRKAQEFDVYPISEQVSAIKIQSDTRIGFIDLNNGRVQLCPPRASGTGYKDLMNIVFVGKLDAGDLLMLKGCIMDSASGMAGTNGVMYCDNSGALDVFGAAA